MNVPLWLWLVTVVGLLVLVAIDLVVVDRHPHRISVAEAGRWVAGYVGAAIVFGLLVWGLAGGRFAGEFFSGYLTEYSLSVDNLFVFLVIMTAFKVPTIHQHRVLLVGILIALLLRGALIIAGAALISRFVAVFYLFGAFLIYTAYRIARTAESDEDSEYSDNVVVRLLRRVVPVTRHYHGSRSLVKVDGQRMITPMLVVMIAIGTTDLLFALDSIPAVFGLTRDSYLVFAVNAFALMGLRQLYFLIGGMLERLVYLRAGLSVLLLFIGVKLILEVVHQDWQPFRGGQQGLPVPVPGPGVSLAVVAGVLGLTVLASLVKDRAGRRAVSGEAGDSSTQS
ncbi:MAG TPA: TerC/Alx family metal homeostasis membrane protein [Pseudonocardiaceae bacterium]|nr:TerC/Alx family metal homeostasis membrane protein [Pseudonocardiaceae bacterium]